MSCLNPKKAFPIGVTSTGKPKYLPVPFEVEYMYKQSGKWYCAYDNFVSPYAQEVVKDYILVPCKKCVGCRMDYSRKWANRNLMESMSHDNSYFITLTYDDEYLPMTEHVDYETGEVFSHATLVKGEISAFMKRLRNHVGDGVKFFGCGEYGSRFFRPHYHIIMHGGSLTIDDTSFDGKSELGHRYFACEEVNKCWKKGYTVTALANWKSMAYTARYVLKKALSDEDENYYENLGIQAPFVVMSNRPGIGYDFIVDHINDFINYDYVSICTPDGGKNIFADDYIKLNIERYIQSLIDSDVPSEVSFGMELQSQYEIKKARRSELALERFLDFGKNTTYSKREAYNIAAESLLNKTKKLKRSYENA